MFVHFYGQLATPPVQVSVKLQQIYKQHGQLGIKMHAGGCHRYTKLHQCDTHHMKCGGKYCFDDV